MLNIFKRKEEKEFIYLFKILDKYLNKYNRNLTNILDKEPKIKTTIDIIRKREGIKESLTCYNKELISILDTYFKEENLLEENKKDIYSSIKGKVENTIGRNISFGAQRLKRAKLVFNNKPPIKGKNSNVNYGGKNTFKIDNVLYLEDMLELLSTKQNIDTSMLDSFFHNLIKNVGNISNGNYLIIFNKVIEHPNFNKNLLKKFVKSQMSKSNEKNFIKGVRHGDDLDLNDLKIIILNKKILKDHEIIDLASLPYIGLWESLIKNYFLNSYLIIDFLDHIFQYDKPEEKQIIINFINSHLNLFFKYPEVKYKIDRYIKSSN